MFNTWNNVYIAFSKFYYTLYTMACWRSICFANKWNWRWAAGHAPECDRCLQLAMQCHLKRSCMSHTLASEIMVTARGEILFKCLWRLLPPLLWEPGLSNLASTAPNMPTTMNWLWPGSCMSLELWKLKHAFGHEPLLTTHVTSCTPMMHACSNVVPNTTECLRQRQPSNDSGFAITKALQEPLKKHQTYPVRFVVC